MSITLPSDTVFHSIERAIKEYRKFSQKNISNQIKDLTIDQGMVLLFLDKHSELTQKEIAALIFKDNASMTRMINLMVNKKYLKRSMNKLDRRRFTIELTAKGKKVLETLPPIILSNREKSLEGITKEEITQVELILKKITANCIKH